MPYSIGKAANRQTVVIPNYGLVNTSFNYSMCENDNEKKQILCAVILVYGIIGIAETQIGSYGFWSTIALAGASVDLYSTNNKSILRIGVKR